MKSVISTGVLALSIAACSEPKDVTHNRAKTSSERGSSLSLEYDNIQEAVERDTYSEYTKYANTINSRYIINQEKLKNMKKDFKSDNSIQRMKYDQEIFDLNKENLQIKSKANDRKNHSQNNWSLFKTTTNTQMKELEESIKLLSEKNQK